MVGPPTQLVVNLDAGPEADDEDLAYRTHQLRRELLELDVESVDLVRADEAPPGAKVVEPFSWGTLIITLAASGGVLVPTINTIQAWLLRDEQRSVTLEIDGDKLEIKGISSKEQQRLINEWLNRHK